MSELISFLDWYTMGESRRLAWEDVNSGGVDDWSKASIDERRIFLENYDQKESEDRARHRAQRDRLTAAFPLPRKLIDQQEMNRLARLLESNRKELKRNALVIYRCGAKGSKGAVRGCLLGAIINLQGDRFWLHQQRVSFSKGEYADLREASEAEAVDRFVPFFHLDIVPARWVALDGSYSVAGMNCAHTDAVKDGIEILDDIERLARERSKTIYLTTGPNF